MHLSGSLGWPRTEPERSQLARSRPLGRFLCEPPLLPRGRPCRGFPMGAVWSLRPRSADDQRAGEPVRAAGGPSAGQPYEASTGDGRVLVRVPSGSRLDRAPVIARPAKMRRSHAPPRCGAPRVCPVLYGRLGSMSGSVRPARIHVRSLEYQTGGSVSIARSVHPEELPTYPRERMSSHRSIRHSGTASCRRSTHARERASCSV